MSWNPYASTTESAGDADDSHAGVDDTETVTVTLHDDGDLNELTIVDDWRSRIDPESLAGAVFTAYSRAERARLDDERERARLDAERTGGAETPGAPVSSVPDIPAELLIEVTREQADYVATFDESLRQHRPLTSADGNVTVTAVGGSLGDVAFDSTWLRFAVGRDIAETARPLVAQAIRTGAEIEQDMRQRFPAVTEFKRLRALKAAARRS
ncbi:hypothetical protein ASF87_08670 [Microbacterium sp. Leaf161]|uniref:hypothetical protein n=1 Tax=Microbacterium sp. Leaf161 TaxID=1736281 RepID=UPI0006F63FD5|nr:hypothetical protein [Microbacterium sp. Leaf161]KQR48891.1 hypothetical protein ASF87_08670 [Microbacterium sp. Leaf161]